MCIRDRVKRKVFDALDIARKDSANIVCFPELSFAKEWIEEIKKRYRNVMIVCGSFYDDSNRNVCKIILDGAEYDYAKCYPSIFEEEDGTGMRCGDRIFVFQTKWGRIAVLNCIDFDKEYVTVASQDLDLVVNIRYDLDSEHGFQRRADICVDRPDGSRSSTFMLQVNAKRIEYDDSVGGEGTVIIGYEHKYRLARYKQDGLRPKDDVRYKIYQARREMLLMADLNISETTRRRTKTGNWYIYDTGSWKKLKDKRIWP